MYLTYPCSFLCNNNSSSERFRWVHNEPHFGSVKKQNILLADNPSFNFTSACYFLIIKRLDVLLPLSLYRASFSISPAFTRSFIARLTVLRESCRSEAIVLTDGQQSTPLPARSHRYIYTDLARCESSSGRAE